MSDEAEETREVVETERRSRGRAPGRRLPEDPSREGELSLGIFYLPRMVGYVRPDPDRSYRDEQAVKAEGQLEREV